MLSLRVGLRVEHEGFSPVSIQPSRLRTDHVAKDP